VSRPGLCETCGDREAARHYRLERADGDTADFYLCLECARRKEARDLQLGENFALSDLLSHLIMADPDASFYCPGCGYDIENLVRTGRTGCPDCYAHFRAEVDRMLMGSIGHLKHLGKSPPAG
jgi:protein arginine kinase activator